MSISITINLSEEVYRRVEKFALLANHDSSSILSDVLAHNLPLIDVGINELQSNNHDKLELISDLFEMQILALTKLGMKPLHDSKLSELLDKQLSGNLAPKDPQELQYLMQTYCEGLLWQSNRLDRSH
jgi:hypothetical protein